MKNMSCQDCGAQVDLPDPTAGRSVKCSQCGSVLAVLAVPTDKDDLMRFVEAEAEDAAKGARPTAPGSPEPARSSPRSKTESDAPLIGNPSMAIRLRGIAWIAGGVGLFYLIFYLLAGVMYSPAVGRHNMGAIKFAAWPLVLAFVGAIELISGYAFYQVAAKWDAMHGLVRFLLGLVIVAISLPLIWLLFEAFLR